MTEPADAARARHRRCVPRSLLMGDPVAVAPRLLGLLLVHGARAGRIVEVEAYRGEDDPASHAYRGRTARNATMYGNAGLLYVYFTYGMHWCANVVCGPAGVAGAVLLRALEPVAGLSEMRLARAERRRGHVAPTERELCRGPGNLTCALGIGPDHDGTDLVRPAGARDVDRARGSVAGSAPRLADDGQRRTIEWASGPRIGISRAEDAPWRYWVLGSPYVSATRASRVR